MLSTKIFLNTWTSALVSAALLAALLLAWYFLLPVQLGGWTGYVTLDGGSMEPDFRSGDLVIVRQQQDYQVGEAVAYFNARLGRFVFHRITGVKEGLYSLKGDNNDWTDPYQPAGHEIIGKQWLHLSGIGRPISVLRTPLNLAILAGILGGVTMWTFLQSLTPAPEKRARERSPVGLPAFDLAFFLGTGLKITSLLVVACLLLLIISFTRPQKSMVSYEIPYRHSGEFAYSATVSKEYFDGGVVQPGQPVFLALICQVNVGYRYSFLGLGDWQLSGTQSFTARVRGDNGWEREIPLTAEELFTGNTHTSLAVIDVCKVRDMADQIEASSGVLQTEYDLLLTPVTKIDGSNGLAEISEVYHPTLNMRFDRLQFKMARYEDEADPFRPHREGLLSGTRLQNNTLGIGRFQMSVLAARILSLAGLSFSAIAGLFFSIIYFDSRRVSPAERLKLKYKDLIVETAEFSSPTGYVDVASFEDLTRVAEKNSSPVLHLRANQRHCYIVQDQANAYRFLLEKNGPGPKEEIARGADSRSKSAAT
jgi:signal peptidase I